MNDDGPRNKFVGDGPKSSPAVLPVVTTSVVVELRTVSQVYVELKLQD